MAQPSEFAKTLSDKLVFDVPPRIVEWGAGVIDRELQEVRECLVGLRRHDRKEDGPCWCIRNTGNHTPYCQRARNLYQRMKVEE